MSTSSQSVRRLLPLRAAPVVVRLKMPVVSPMPGRIVKILVQTDQAVESGDPVIVVEAMKMENELRAPRAGTIGKIHVAVGDRVEGNTTLVDLS